jgi:hypothetical protein
MPADIDRCRPFWETAILCIIARWGPGDPRPENFRERGRGLRRRSLVTNSMRAAGFNSRHAPGPGPQRVELEFWGSEPYFSSSSALVSSVSEFHCRSAAVFCRAEWEEPVLGFLTAKPALPAPLPPQAIRGPDSRLMFHVPVGADLCRPPWQTQILMRNTNVGPWGLAPERLP